MMEDLIERLTNAAGPSADLDVDIEVAVPGRWPKRRSNARYKVVTTYEDGRTGVHRPRDYTSDIDAALTLIPDGWQWQISNRAPGSHAGRAYLNNRELINVGAGGLTPNAQYRGEEVTAATPALALCIAALKARAAQ